MSTTPIIYPLEPHVTVPELTVSRLSHAAHELLQAALESRHAGAPNEDEIEKAQDELEKAIVAVVKAKKKLQIEVASARHFFAEQRARRNQ